MKQCPNCRAEIDDDARFCVFCMSSLQKKENIKSKKETNKIWLYVVAISLLVILILSLVISLLIRKPEGDPYNDSDAVNSTVESVISQEYTNDKNNSEEETGSSSNDSNSKTLTSQNEDDSSEDEQSDVSSGSSAAAPSAPTTPSSSINSTTEPVVSNTPTTPEKEEDKTPDEGTSSDTNTEEEDDSNISIYEYRDAQKSDYTGYETDNAVVITKVILPTSDGVYVIPEKINGKTVVAIMDNAFGGDNVKNTVQTVVIPATLRTMWANAFFSCHNLAHLYIKGDGFYLYDNFFPPVQRRNVTITIHSSKTCRDTKTSVKFSLLAGYNNALFEEWDGGELK